MTQHADFGRFFLPGPTEVHPDVLAAMRRPVIGHRGPEMSDLLASVDRPLRQIFGAERPVYISTSSATGFMEAAISNLSRRRILCLVGGAFGERFHAIATRCGRPADRLEVEWGQPNTPDDLRDALAEDPGRYDLVTVVHSETSTGVLNPITQLAGVVSEFDDILLAVDGVTSVGGTRIEFENWGVDFLLTGSQKALALPPGLAFAVASDAALARAASIPDRGFYFDLVEFDRRAREFSTTNTPAVSLFYALHRQLERIADEGLDERFARHERMARRTAAWTESLAATSGRPFRVLAPPGYRSPTVTAISLPHEVSAPGVVGRLADQGITIAAGYGKLKNSTIRIGHMGDHTEAELEVVLDAVTAAGVGSRESVAPAMLRDGR